MFISDIEITGWNRVYVLQGGHTYRFLEAKKILPDAVIKKIHIVEGAIYFEL